MDSIAASRWLEAYRRAWEQADPEAVTALFTEDARYRSHPLRPVHRGRPGIAEYWAGVTGSQRAVDLRWGQPMVQGERVAVEWWAIVDLLDAPSESIAGVLLLTFDDGLCSELRESWNETEGRVPAPEGWGELEASDGDGLALARRWADGYERAWRSADAEAAASLYSDDVIYRSQPFREPYEGREGVLAYTRDNFDIEEGQDPRFAVPIAAGRDAVVEYWVPMVEEGKDSTLIGSVVLRFGEDGLVRESREYWFMEPGRLEPYEGWGR